MGNVNGRDDDVSEVVEEEEEDEEEDMLSTSAPIATTSPHSPPQTPGAAHSPLKFAPQPPVPPLQKPDELHIPNPSWLPTPTPTPLHEQDIAYDYEQGIPTMITWTYGGTHVFVQGSWDNWITRNPLQRSGKDFTLMKVLPSGVYQYFFVVDGTRRYAPDIPWTLDEFETYYNVLDLQDYVPEDTESISGFKPPLSPDGSYDNTVLNQEDFTKEPPLVPPHLNLTLLNVPSLCDELPPPSLSRPQHVVLNHLYMQKGKSGSSIVALGSTHRFKSKYVTVVLYKSL